jgi:hypothetical protein
MVEWFAVLGILAWMGVVDILDHVPAWQGRLVLRFKVEFGMVSNVNDVHIVG